MGQLAASLTNPGIQSGADGRTQYFPSPGAAGIAMARQAAQTSQPSTSDVGNEIGGTQAPTVNQPTPAQPKMIKPSFIQAATSGPYGMPNAASPELSKMGKLAVILTSGIKGALAGRAAQEQTIAQTGGHRAGGVGTGFQAGFMQPFQQAQVGQQLAQQQAQTELTKQQAQLVPTPYGYMPAALAKAILPASIREQGTLGAAGIKAQGGRDVANIQQQTQQQIHRYIPVPGVGLFDTQTRQNIPETEQGITITPEIAKDHNLPAEFIGKPMSLQQLAAVQRSDVFQNSPMMTASGPIVVNRKTSTATPVQGPGGQTYAPPALAAPREIADTDNPGQTKIVSGGTAIAQGAAGPTSASVQVPRKAELSEVPTNIGNQKVAFNTAIAHASLLRTAAKALNNGDTQTLAGLKNRFKNEFGYEGPITTEAISDAYGREVTKMLSGGHMTDSEIGKIGKTIDPQKQNYKTVDSVLGAYQALAQSKMNMLNQQSQSAIKQSQPKGTGGGKVLVEGKDF